MTSHQTDADGYPRKRARTRRSLLTAGRIVLAEKGPDGATVGQIAKAAHVSSGTFYNHFLSIEALVEEVVRELADALKLGRDTLNTIEHDPAMRVLLGAVQLMRLADDDPVSASAFVSLLATVPNFRDRVRSLVSGAMVDGVEAGRFVAHEPTALTDAVLGATIQWMRSTLAAPGPGGSHQDRLRLVLAMVGVAEAEHDGLLGRVESVLHA